jgi:NAD(P)-dependent dehydrogenase (short-subunit alcohol dehydrogenase family)
MPRMAQGGDPASWEQNFRLDLLGAVNAFEAARSLLEASGEKTGDAAFVIISSISAAQARQLIRPDQGGADPHGQGTGAAIRRAIGV